MLKSNQNLLIFHKPIKIYFKNYLRSTTLFHHFSMKYHFALRLSHTFYELHFRMKRLIENKFLLR